MANPLRSVSTTGGGSLPPGSARPIEVRDKSGNVIKMLTVYRTNREYVYDLADAYNAGMDPSARQRGAQWQVGHNGELKLGYSDESIRENRRQATSRLETERARYIRHQLENQPRDPS